MFLVPIGGEKREHRHAVGGRGLGRFRPLRFECCDRLRIAGRRWRRRGEFMRFRFQLQMFDDGLRIDRLIEMQHDHDRRIEASAFAIERRRLQLDRRRDE